MADAPMWVGQGGSQFQQNDDGAAKTLQAALLRMTPEQRAAMFRPYQDELSVLNAQAQPQQHSTPGGALFGGLANMFAGMDRKDLLAAMQKDALARTDARYGTGADQQSRAAMAAALRKASEPVGAGYAYEAPEEG